MKLMADRNDKFPENVLGAYYITNQCIDCDMCRETAPTVFRRDDNIGFSVAFHQPETEAGRLEAEAALQGCPTDAIGNDGVIA